MKTTITAALLIAAASAQTNSTATTTTTTTSTTDKIKDTFNDVLNWFSGKTQQYLSGNPSNIPFGSYNSTATTNGLDATIALDQTALGVDFVRYTSNYHGLTNFGAGSTHLVYFQIEQPVVTTSTAAHRFLQTATTNSTTTSNSTAVVTGTGYYEGMAYVFNVKAGANATAPTSMVENRNVNLWGKTNLKTANNYWSAFGGADATNTTSTSAW
jgi:hypothetical protein